MSRVQPFGQLHSATILVIGHDPRLQRSQTEAEFAFFMDYLTRPRPALRSEQRKYDLAGAVVSYVSELAGRPVAVDEIHITNLCNEFLDHAPNSGTVLISDDKANKVGIFTCQYYSTSPMATTARGIAYSANPTLMRSNLADMSWRRIPICHAVRGHDGFSCDSQWQS